MIRSTEAEIYAREAERARSQLTRSIDELRGRMTMGDVFEELVSYMRVGGSNVAAGLGNAMRDHPVPTMLIATGCAMFLRGAGNGRRGPSVANGERGYAGANHAGDPASGVGDAIAGAGGAIRDAASGAAGAVSGAAAATANAVGDAASAAGETLRGAAGSVRDTAAGAAGAVRETATSATAAAGEAVRGASETVRGYAATASERASQGLSEAERRSRELYGSAMRLAEEQPLLVAALGVALGAAIGAALPSTKVEDELLGESADAVKRAASGALDDVGDVLSREGSAVAEDVRQTVGDVRDAVGEVTSGERRS